MRNYKINENVLGEMESITVETGLLWGSIYGLASPYLIVGAADFSVGPGGYSLRGGHSPIGPQYGLSSDFTIEYVMVDATAQIIHIYNTSGINQTIDHLFWSLKGGGGSTFGVIVNITFAVHPPVPHAVFTSLFCDYPFYSDPITKQHFIGDIILNNLWKIVQTELDPEWGGYLMSLNGQSLFFIVGYYGNSTYAMMNAEPLRHLSDFGACNQFQTYQTLLQYMSIYPVNTGGEYLQIYNHLITKENLTQEYTDMLCEYFNSSSNGYTNTMTGIFQGGKINSFSDDYTSVTPAFRNNWFEITLENSWQDGSHTNDVLQHAHFWESKFEAFAIGKYSNEENYECGNPECDWKQQFYGSHYDRLLKVKQKWDPNQVFWCFHGVGSDQ